MVSGRMPGAVASKAVLINVRVASPRHQVRDPMSLPRSGTQSMSAMRVRQWVAGASAGFDQLTRAQSSAARSSRRNNPLAGTLCAMDSAAVAAVWPANWSCR